MRNTYKGGARGGFPRGHCWVLKTVPKTMPKPIKIRAPKTQNPCQNPCGYPVPRMGCMKRNISSKDNTSTNVRQYDGHRFVRYCYTAHSRVRLHREQMPMLGISPVTLLTREARLYRSNRLRRSIEQLTIAGYQCSEDLLLLIGSMVFLSEPIHLIARATEQIKEVL